MKTGAERAPVSVCKQHPPRAFAPRIFCENSGPYFGPIIITI